MEFGDAEEAAVVAGLLGGFAGAFIRPWAVSSAGGGLVGLGMAGGLTLLVSTLAADNFRPGTSAVMSVFVTVMVMHASVV
jgi:hypothetical protein